MPASLYHRVLGAGEPTQVVAQYVWGARPGHRDELIMRDRDTTGDGTLDERLYCLMDYYNPVAVVDAAGAVKERYAWSAFGLRTVMGPDWAVLEESAFAWDFGFHGQFSDGETGYYDYGFRNYSPGLGRWINRDPIAETGGGNIYALNGNNANGGLDQYGLFVLVTNPPGTGSTTNYNISARFAFVGNQTLDEVKNLLNDVEKFWGRTYKTRDGEREYNVSVALELIDGSSLYQEDIDCYLTRSELAHKYNFNIFEFVSDRGSAMLKGYLAKGRFNEKLEVYHEIGHLFGARDHYGLDDLPENDSWIGNLYGGGIKGGANVDCRSIDEIVSSGSTSGKFDINAARKRIDDLVRHLMSRMPDLETEAQALEFICKNNPIKNSFIGTSAP